MQSTHCRHRTVAFGSVLAGGLLGVLVGCGGGSTAPTTPTGDSTDFSGRVLTVGCDDPSFARVFSNRARAWAGRTGAVVKVEAQSKDADIQLLRSPTFGGPASRNELAPLPTPLRASSNTRLQWDRLLDIYRMNLASWGEEYLGLPVAGDAFVVVYRADLIENANHKAAFSIKFPQKPLGAPGTWEDLADIAAYFTEAQGKPSLPPLPADPTRLVTQFHQLAACYDRLADTNSRAASKGLGLHFQGENLEHHRLGLPGFLATFQWFADTKSSRPPEPSDDPIAALDRGSAVIAVLSLAEVARLPKDPATGGVLAKFKVAPLPGTRTYFDAQGKRSAPGRPNYVPYLGSGGWIGAVSKTSSNAAAAWELLAEMASMTGSSAMMSEPTAGIGPFRIEHLDATHNAIWHGHQFDPDRSRDLANAVYQYVSQSIVNPALPLRTPDQAARSTALEVEIRKAATGKVSANEAQANAVESWNKLDATQNPDERTRWRKNSVGLRSDP